LVKKGMATRAVVADGLHAAVMVDGDAGPRQPLKTPLRIRRDTTARGISTQTRGRAIRPAARATSWRGWIGTEEEDVEQRLYQPARSRGESDEDEGWPDACAPAHVINHDPFNPATMATCTTVC
jgi:hypothetical protein